MDAGAGSLASPGAGSEAAGGSRQALWLILIVALLDMMAMGIVMPVLPVLIEELTGSIRAAGIWTGVIASLWAAMQFFCAPVIGVLSDRFGRRPVILFSTAGLALSWAMMALAPNLWWLLAGRVIGGLTSATAPAIFAYLADITPPQGRARAFGLAGAAISAGFVVGPAVGGMLGEWGARLPLWAAAGLCAAAFLYGLFVLPESLRPELRSRFSWAKANPLGALRLLRSHHELAALSVSNFLLSFAHRIFTAVFVLYGGQRFGLGVFELGALLAALGAIDLLIQGVIAGAAAERFGERRVMIFGLACGALGLVAMGFADTGLLFALALLPNSLWGLAEPTLRALLSARVSDAEQGQLQGANHCVISLAGITGPLFFGWLYGVSLDAMPGLTFLAGAVVVAAAALFGLERPFRRASAPPR